ncbi:MAG: nucleoside-diphosphate kinase [Vicinamibacteria bacterium]
MEKTFSIIKPDAVKAGNTGAILSRLEKAGFRLVALRMRHLSTKEAEGFYHVHKARPFFGELVAFMSSGPCVTMVLEKQNGILGLRDLMGATNPANAAEGTIRKDFAVSIEANAIHGSDAPETAAFEIGYFFPGMELFV